jgi:hypothetical protein
MYSTRERYTHTCGRIIYFIDSIWLKRLISVNRREYIAKMTGSCIVEIGYCGGDLDVDNRGKKFTRDFLAITGQLSQLWLGLRFFGTML